MRSPIAKKGVQADTPSKGAKSLHRRTASVDISVNEVNSRTGKATIHFYMQISKAVKEMERRALGLEEGAKRKRRPQEEVPGLRALRKKKAHMLNQPQVVSAVSFFAH